MGGEVGIVVSCCGFDTAGATSAVVARPLCDSPRG